MWGGLIDYYAYTNDSRYVDITIQALVAQSGPKGDFIVPAHRGDEGNDDQAFWGMGVMSAIENGFPAPPPGTKPWLELVKALFENQAARWDNTSCGGGLKWQIYPENAYGYDYKNAISNGAFFQIAARLALYTGEMPYIDLATRVWDWCWRIGLISPSYNVYDGSDDKKNCTELDHTQWSYNVGVFLQGTAALWNLTKEDVWRERTLGLVQASSAFFAPFPNAPFPNATNIMFEPACEPANKCNNDQLSFKAYLGRWLAKTMVLAPFTEQTVRPWLEASAIAAAASCSGGTDGVTCGSKWWVGGWDGTWGAGQQLSALEVVQGLLVANAGAPRSVASVANSSRGCSIVRSRDWRVRREQGGGHSWSFSGWSHNCAV